MLYIVVFSFIFNALNACAVCSHNTTCPVSLQEDFIKDSLKTVETMTQNKGLQSFLTHSLKQRETALKSRAFQETVSGLQKSSSPASPTRGLFEAADSLNNSSHLSGQMPKSLSRSPIESVRSESMLYIFVSFSMGEKALLNLAQEVKPYGATLVLRGFIEGSYAKTVQALAKVIQETGLGFIIDPELFSLFGITAVPTYILARPFQFLARTRNQTPLHDRLMGHVSVSYALESFAQSGDLEKEAQALLDKRRIP